MIGDVRDLLNPIRRIHERVRDAVVAECEQQGLEQLAAVADDESPGDTIYAVDRVSEDVVIELFEKELACVAPLVGCFPLDVQSAWEKQCDTAHVTVRRFIAPGEAHAFPLGTVDTFSTYFAPADFNETVNTLGQELFAKQEPRKFERGTDVHTQSNPLPMCHRPGVLVKLKF